MQPNILYSINLIMKNPKFAIAENPMTEGESHPLYIIHLRDPFICAQVFTFEGDDETAELELRRQIQVGATTDVYGDERAVIAAIYVAPNELSADKLAGLMRRMADWYRAYCLWEDSNA